MATCQACGRQSNNNQHSCQLHWSLHWNHQLVKYCPQDLKSCRSLQQCYQISLHQHMWTLWVEHTLRPKTTVQPPSIGTTATTQCHLCFVSIGIHSLTMSPSQILQHHHYASLLLWLSSCHIRGVDCVNTRNQAYAVVFHQGTSVFQLM
jgi:hypothetical protein